MNWADIDASLPATKIEVLGPPPTSGTRDAFVKLVMDAACQAEVKAANEKGCGEIREDGAYVEAGENDNLIVQKLEANPAAFGIFGFSFLDQNADKLQGHKIDGVEPTFENIADRQVRRLSFALHLRQEGTCRRDPRHGRVHRRIHLRRGSGPEAISPTRA